MSLPPKPRRLSSPPNDSITSSASVPIRLSTPERITSKKANLTSGEIFFACTSSSATKSLRTSSVYGLTPLTTSMKSNNSAPTEGSPDSNRLAKYSLTSVKSPTHLLPNCVKDNILNRVSAWLSAIS